MIVIASDTLGAGIATNDNFIFGFSYTERNFDREEYLGSNKWIYYYDISGSDYISAYSYEVLVTDSGEIITDITYYNADEIVITVEEIDQEDPDTLEQFASGRDELTGNKFKDTLYGYAGNDALNGLGGADSLNGGAGKDSLTGGSGSDIFIFKATSESSTTARMADAITDFVIDKDEIKLSAIDAFAPSAINDTFVWKGTAAFSSTTKGEVRYEKFDKSGTSDDYTMVWIDNDRDKDVEMAIRLTGLHNLTESDFIL